MSLSLSRKDWRRVDTSLTFSSTIAWSSLSTSLYRLSSSRYHVRLPRNNWDASSAALKRSFKMAAASPPVVNSAISCLNRWLSLLLSPNSEIFIVTSLFNSSNLTSVPCRSLWSATTVRPSLLSRSLRAFNSVLDFANSILILSLFFFCFWIASFALLEFPSTSAWNCSTRAFRCFDRCSNNCGLSSAIKVSGRSRLNASILAS